MTVRTPIDWDRFETNQQLLAANAAAHGNDRATGPPREGPALLQGMVICGRCGRRMTVRYHHRRGVDIPDYECIGEAIQGGGPRCQAVPGAGVDAAIGQLLLDTVTPLALEVALTVQAELEARADEAGALRRSHVERARHRTELARRRYLAVDPDNRLVADSLEADRNDALRSLQDAHDDEHQSRVRALAVDFPALWSDPATPQRERKRMARLLLDDVTLVKNDEIHLHVRFRGGHTISLTPPIPPMAWQAGQTEPEKLALLDRLLDNHTDAEVAEQLNAVGHRSGEGKPFTARIVLHLRRARKLPSHADRLRSRGMLNLTEMADRLDVNIHTVKRWHAAGFLVGHKANDKNEQLYEPPTPGDPRLVKCMGRKLSNRVPTEPIPGGAV